MSQVSNYKCPSCTGPLHFVGASGKLECDYCGGSFDIAEIERKQADKDAKAEAAGNAAREREAALSEEEREARQLKDKDGTVLYAYSCPSCGAELICEKETLAGSCPYCGNPTVVPSAASGDFRPDFIIPFKLDKAAAIAGLKKFYEGKRLLPSDFVATNHLEEIKGVYVPFWLYDGQAHARATFEGRNVHVFRMGNVEVTRTEHYDVYREGVMAFQNIPADASTKMPDEYMDSVEPYDYGALKPYSHAYLPGFLASTYDVAKDANADRVEPRIKETSVSVLRSDVVGYHSVSLEGAEVNIRYTGVKYALLPVWMLSTRWNGQSFLFAMNGQTGKFVGNLPVSTGKFIAYLVGMAVPFSALCCAAAYFLMQ